MDVVMPFFSGNRLFPPALVIAIVLFIWKGGARGRVFAVMLVLTVALGDTFICNTIKNAVHRPRPFFTLPDVHVPSVIGKTGSGSMPSSHAANWFAATMLAFIYYRRSLRFMLPLALLVCLSRIYCGVHYPSDVAVGAILGAGYAAGFVWVFNALWQWIGRRWFPLWWQELPSLFDPSRKITRDRITSTPALVDQHYIRLAYVLIFVELFANLAYLASGKIDLSEDEAYQWTWSKHLALAYYSKPPFIALIQWLGTHIWGDTEFGVRFFSPVITAFTAVVVLRFIRRVANARAAFWLTVVMTAIPLLSVGSILMTIDPLSVMFWIFTMIAGWRAIRDDSTWRDWFWVGLWMGCGFLSKQISLGQLVSFALFFALWPPARKQLRRPGIYFALLVNLICAIPVLVWNQQNHWITVTHISQDAHFDEHWSPTLANLLHGFLHYTLDFIGVETALQNPFFFLPVAWAAIVFWRHREIKRPLLVYFFCMGAPVFLGYFVQSFHARVLPNWIATSILPLFCLAAVYWEERWRLGFRAIKYWVFAGLFFGFFAIVILHDTNLLTKLTGFSVPPALDSTHRVRGWTETADAVKTVRDEMLAEGKPVFIICGHYGMTGELSFYMPEAKAHIKDNPLVYYETSPVPVNQFYFWPGYLDRVGQNALYVRAVALTEMKSPPVPEVISNEFVSAVNLGLITIESRGKPVHKLQIVECRNLR
jgi:4-amino-4-deoxy-L-arabinose transferase-like glycosyltransferase/membrane-associated phospholipid phosphatase